MINKKKLYIVALITCTSALLTNCTPKKNSFISIEKQLSPTDMIAKGIPMELGTTVPKDWDGAISMYESACLEGSRAGCYLLDSIVASHKELSAGVRHEVISVLEQQCAQNHLRSCFRAALLYDDDNGMPIDGKQAFTLFKKSCDGGYTYGCLGLAVYYLVSEASLESEAEQKSELYGKQVCEAGLGIGCDFLAYLQPNTIEGRALKYKACELGHISSCLSIIQNKKPQPAFACDTCTEQTLDSRCLECRIAKCRKKFCCDTCPLRTKHGCCDNTHLEIAPHPLITEPVPEPKIKAYRSESRKLLEPSMKMLEELCQMNHPNACTDLKKIKQMDIWRSNTEMPPYPLEWIDEAKNRYGTGHLICEHLVYKDGCNETRSGKVVMKVHLDKNGHVHSMEIVSSTIITDPELVYECIQETVRPWQFNAPKGVQTSFEMTFILSDMC